MIMVRDWLIAARAVLPLVASLLPLVGPGTTYAATETVLYSFQGGSDGASPYAGLAVGEDGTLYGTTLMNFAGSPNHGTVFSLKAPATVSGSWSEAVLYTFTGGSDGGSPVAGVVIGKNGRLYGTTSAGGASSNAGTVFELRPLARNGSIWSETVLHSFTGPDGADPRAGLVIGKDGALYGTTTFAAEPYCCGTVFQLTPPETVGGLWELTVLQAFSTDSAGGYPYAGLVLGKKGRLYGTTYGGGTSPGGTVFELKPPAAVGGAWTGTVLHSFGGNPYAGLVIGKNDALYGTTYGGGGQGSVFQLTPPAKITGAWTETVLHSFAGNDGAAPAAGLVIGTDGSLYGTTQYGGTSNFGTVFQLTPPTKVGDAWSETVLHSFAGGSDGANPVAGLVIGPNGALYGTTSFGGVPYTCGLGPGCGTVFEVIP
jgi:uncharacterized repeat protein (TIGR03803 family)